MKMTPRMKEHFEIACYFGNEEFSAEQFKEKYQKIYPARPTTSMIPSDYCIDLNPIGAEDFPKFLLQPRYGCYQLITGRTIPDRLLQSN
jgi:hypothetical protein